MTRMNKRTDYYLAALIMSDLADLLKEGSEILMEEYGREKDLIDELTANKINRIREEIKNTKPERRWRIAKKLVNDKSFSLQLIKTRKKDTPSKISLVLSLLQEGKTQTEIAQQLGCSRAWVSLMLKRHKLKEGRTS